MVGLSQKGQKVAAVFSSVNDFAAAGRTLERVHASLLFFTPLRLLAILPGKSLWLRSSLTIVVCFNGINIESIIAVFAC